MELIIYQMLNDGKFFQIIFQYFKLFLGYRFDKPEYIMANLQQGIWYKRDVSNFHIYIYLFLFI